MTTKMMVSLWVLAALLLSSVISIGLKATQGEEVKSYTRVDRGRIVDVNHNGMDCVVVHTRDGGGIDCDWSTR